MIFPDDQIVSNHYATIFAIPVRYARMFGIFADNRSQVVEKSKTVDKVVLRRAPTVVLLVNTWIKIFDFVFFEHKTKPQNLCPTPREPVREYGHLVQRTNRTYLFIFVFISFALSRGL